MVTKYPHILTATVLSGGGQDANGYPISGSTSVVSFKCRYRPNTAAKQIRTVDGQTVVYRGTVYIDKGALPIKTGDLITVIGFIEDVEVVQVYHAQMRTRIIC